MLACVLAKRVPCATIRTWLRKLRLPGPANPGDRSDHRPTAVGVAGFWLLRELDRERALPLIPEENNLPFNFGGHAQFYPDRRLRFLASFCGLTQLHLSPDHGSDVFASNSEELPEGWVKDPMYSVRVCGDHGTEQR